MLDKCALAGVVDHVEIGSVSVVRRPDFESEGVEIMFLQVFC